MQSVLALKSLVQLCGVSSSSNIFVFGTNNMWKFFYDIISLLS